MTGKLIDDCFLHDRERLSHGEAIALLKSRTGVLTRPVAVPLADAGGRILATEAVARIAVPAHTNAAVDGYAFAAADLSAAPDAALPIAGRAAAGHPFAGPARRGHAVRILTGAVVPAGCDTVVMQEDVTLFSDAEGSKVRIPTGLKVGANVRKAGEDVGAGQVLLHPGHVVRPQDLAALASIGIGEIACHEPLRVAIVSTGDEVVVPGSRALNPGEVYDANAPMLASLVASAGAVPSRLGILPDDASAVRAALIEASRSHHVVLTSGGASRGEEDHLAAVLDDVGRRHMWQVAIKPGRPIMFGQVGDCVVVGLPGNPVAVFVCFLMYVWPMLRRLGGAPWPEPRRWRLPSTFAFHGRKTGRREFWRGMLVETADGLAVDKFARDGSGLISGLRASDGLIEIPEASGDVSIGDLVDFIPFSEFGIPTR